MSRSTNKRRPRFFTLAVIIAALSVVPSLAYFSGGQASVSAHRDAPLIAGDPMADVTDLYAFVSPDAPETVTVIANFYPFQNPAGEPTSYAFADDVHYNIRFDNDADAVPDLTYQFRFSTGVSFPTTILYTLGPIDSLQSENWNVRQFYSLYEVDEANQSRQVAEGMIVPPVNLGPSATPNYEELAASAVFDVAGDIRVFAGQRDDPFFGDRGAFSDLLSLRTFPGVDGVAGMNVQTIAMQIPIATLTNDGSTPTDLEDPAAIVGVWATTSRNATVTHNADGTRVGEGNFVQVARVGTPLFSQFMLPLSEKDRFNASSPVDDEQFLPAVQDPELPQLLTAYGLEVPPSPRTDLELLYMTGLQGLNHPPDGKPSEMLRLNVAVPPAEEPNRLSVLANDLAGFPNGRRLIDDMVDVELRILVGATPGGDLDVEPNNQLGDNVDANDVPFLTEFPYVALPHEAFSYAPAVAAQPEGEATPVAEPTASVEEATAPPEEEPTDEPTAPADEPTAEAEEPTDEPTAPVEEPTAPAEEPTADTASDPAARSIIIELRELNDSGISGTAFLTADGDRTEIVVAAVGATGGHPIHIHRGTCDVLVKDPLYPLPDIDANGDSELTIPVTFDELTRGEYVLHIHKSREEFDQYVMCGEITGGA